MGTAIHSTHAFLHCIQSNWPLMPLLQATCCVPAVLVRVSPPEHAADPTQQPENTDRITGASHRRGPFIFTLYLLSHKLIKAPGVLGNTPPCKDEQHDVVKHCFKYSYPFTYVKQNKCAWLKQE